MHSHVSAPQTLKTIESLWKIQKIILDTLDYSEVTQKVCDGLLQEFGYLDLGYRIIVLTMLSKGGRTIERVAVSQTKEAEQALAQSKIPFKKILVPTSETDSLLVKVVKTNTVHITNDWHDILRPVFTAKESHIMQAAAGIKTSMVYPVTVRGQVIGSVIFSMTKSKNDVSSSERDLIRGFCEIVGLSVQNASLYTSLERTSRKLEKANQELRELDKMKDEFVALASHELRTPLTSIRNYLWMSLYGEGSGKLSKKQRYHLNRSYRATERLITLVNDILNVSRIESGRMSLAVAEVSLHTLFTRSVEELQARADDVEVTIHVERKGENELSHKSVVLPPVIADTDKIKEVIINLIGNSLKFTPKGGAVTVSFSFDDEFVYAHIRDTGVGMTHEAQKRLFEKFGLMADSYRGNKNTAQGTGLGLYICKELIQLHGGKIWAESEGVGKGATFSFSLPRYSKVLHDKFAKKYAGMKDAGLVKRSL